MKPVQKLFGNRLHVSPRDGIGQDQFQQFIVEERFMLECLEFLPQTLSVSGFVLNVHADLRKSVTDSKWPVAGNMSIMPAV